MEKKPFIQRLSALKQEHQNFVTQFKDLSTYIRPTRGFFDETPSKNRAPDYKTLIDGTSTRAARIGAAGLSSGITSPSRPWFKYGLVDRDLMEFAPVRYWLDVAQARTMSVFSKSNIYGVLHTMYEELFVFGSASSIVLEDFDTVIRGRAFTCGEYYLGTGHDGRVNTFGREYWQTVGQLIKDFGKENVTDTVRSMYERGEVDKWFKVCHLIEPNDDRIPEKQDFRNMQMRSVYWLDASSGDEFLRVSGYEDFPILAPRWDVATTIDSYGTSPGWDALGDIKQLQKMQKDKLIALSKMVNPPVQRDASVQGEVNTLPGGVTYSSSQQPNAGVRAAYQVNPDLSSLQASINEVQRSVEKYFYTDLFLMLAQAESPQKTAFEISKRYEEKLLMLGPVLERLNSELLNPLIDRTFNIQLRNGVIPPPPKELQGKDIKVEYISILAQAQKMVGTTAIQQFSSFAGSLAAVRPDVLDKVNFDEMLDIYGDDVGLPPKIIYSDETVAQIRKQKQVAAQQAAAMQNAGAMVQGAKVLSDTEIGNNSALDALIGSAQ
jgi:hypothetical protein